MVGAARVAPVDQIDAFGRFAIAFELLVTYRRETQIHPKRAQNGSRVHGEKPTLGLVHHKGRHFGPS